MFVEDVGNFHMKKGLLFPNHSGIHSSLCGSMPHDQGLHDKFSLNFTSRQIYFSFEFFFSSEFLMRPFNLTEIIQPLFP